MADGSTTALAAPVCSSFVEPGFLCSRLCCTSGDLLFVLAASVYSSVRVARASSSSFCAADCAAVFVICCYSDSVGMFECIRRSSFVEQFLCSRLCCNFCNLLAQ